MSSNCGHDSGFSGLVLVFATLFMVPVDVVVGVTSQEKVVLVKVVVQDCARIMEGEAIQWRHGVLLCSSRFPSSSSGYTFR